MAHVALPDIQQSVAQWETKGKDDYFKTLRPHVLNAEDPASRDILLDGFYVLVKATTSLFGKPALKPAAFAALVMSFTEGLPSTSKDGHVQWNTPLVAVLEEVILDTIWTVETEVEDLGPEGQKPSDEDKKPLAEIVQILMSHGVLRRSVCRDRLEFHLLGLAKLVDYQKVTSRVARVRTAMLYKQRKFNLLRETNEGYAKLISEITSLVGPPHSSETGLPVESIGTTRKRARAAWGKVVGIIGYFDLDPNRVLDVLLDVFSTYLIEHHRFFMELIRCSGWSRAKPASESSSMAVDEEPSADKYKGKTFEEILKIAEQPLAKNVSGDPPILSDVLGFKFAHYQAPGSAQDTVRPLYFLTALLIRERFIELSDVYDHLTPLDPALAAMEEKAVKWARKQLVAPPRSNALANAAALESSYHHRGATSAKEEETKKPEDEPDSSNGPHNQKLFLLKALLALGAAHPAFWIIAKFPWMIHAYSDVTDLVLRLTKQSLKPLVSGSLPACKTAVGYGASNARAKLPFVSSDRTARAPKPKDHVLVFDAPPPVGTMTRTNVFFYPHWRQLIPACSNDEDIVSVVQPLLQALGTRISRNPNLLIDLCKLGSLTLAKIDAQSSDDKDINEEADKQTQRIWSDLVRLYLLPATSLVTANRMVSSAIWDLVSRFPTESRWMFYEEWSQYGVDKLTSRPHPELAIQTKETRREIRDILRRISSSVSGRAFSIPIYHLMHSNPIPLFSVAISQVQSYPNFPAHVAEALEYMTPLGYDVLVHNIISIFADPNKETLKEDGTSLVDWIHNLASFTGKMLRAHRELSPETFLRYIVHQLHNNSVKEVLLLSEIISTMTSIAPPADYNDAQVSASSGGPLLWLESTSQLTRGSRSAALKRGNASGMKRLIRSLTSDDQLGPQLLVAVAQYRGLSSYRVKDDEWHPKSLSHVFDQAHGVLLQAVELLASALTPEQYAAFVPSLGDLCSTYGLEPAVAFHILRPGLEKAVSDWSYAQELERKEAEVKEKLRARQTAAASGVNPGQANAAPVNASQASSTPPSSADTVIWPPLLTPLIETAKVILPPQALKLVGAHFFTTFWQMSLADLAHPSKPYEIAIKACETFSKKKEPNDTSPSEREIATDNRRLSEEIRTALLVEMRQSLDRYAGGSMRMRREKSKWFSHLMDSPTYPSVPLMNEIVQHCFLPRALMSPADAEYCATFIRTLHKNATPGFSTLVCYDRLIGDQLATVITSCSDREIVNFSRFFRRILQHLGEWNDQGKYTEQAISGGVWLPGLVKKVTSLGKKEFQKDDLLSASEVAVFIQKLHKKILKAAMTCLESNEYRSVKNIFLVLNGILEEFPKKTVNAALGITLQPAVKAFLTDDRNDIKVLATGYYNKLEQKRDSWLPEMPPALAASLTNGPNTVPQSSTVPAADSPAPSSNQAQPSSTSGHEINATATSTAQQVINGLPAKPQPVPRTSSATSGNPQPPSRSVPSAPGGSSSGPTHRPSESIPRPEFIPRGKTGASTSVSASAGAGVHESRSSQGHAAASSTSSPRVSPGVSTLPAKPKDQAMSSLPARPDGRTDVTQSPRPSRRTDDPPNRNSQPMPPPPPPNAKPAAQELRSSAKGASTGRDETDERSSRAPRRSSPQPSRPGTRDGSAESRTSDPTRGDRTRDRGDRTSKRDRDQEADRDPDRSSGRNKAREDGRDRRSDRDRDTRDRERDRERDKDKDRDRERDRPARDRERHRREREPSTRKERDREGASTTTSSRGGGRRDDDRTRTEPPRDESSRARGANDESSHKRRREDEQDGGPSKRMREIGREGSRSPPRVSPRETNGRDKRDDWSPNGRDRFRGEDDRRSKDTNGRDGNRNEEPRTQPPRDRERDRDKDRAARDSDRREDRLKDDRGRRETGRESERDRDRLEGRTDASESRRDRREREPADRPSERRDSVDYGKKVGSTTAAGPPSEPRAMKVNKSSVSDATTARVGAMQSEALSNAAASSMRGSNDSNTPQSKLLSRISQDGQTQPPTGPSRAPSHRQSSTLRRNQPGPGPSDSRNGSGIPSKRTGPEAGSDPSKRLRLNRRDLDGDDNRT